ncbi:alanyl-tRNA editing protein [Ammoniphilus sp. CFH 90114]|uniref:alanyl-tRNA editing protein n=1 Tax=Ammoniphilus sp. CFH 90114 TaxID=2493665 RepID=UPI00100EBCCB|nr:alanyl-tRNA editing protein [Ammoniphilus sp. CFH 90114]RXT07038.1 alanyl-tRNA editing protein [Ammoniphilus sp. CFH 90114]
MTKELYITDSYLRECACHILSVDGEKVIVDQTVCYPTGGGQEHDTGVIIQNGQEFEIFQVKKQSGQIVHFVKNAHLLAIGEAEIRLDWDRRYSLMSHHTLLHVLGAVVYKKYGALCTGNQIYPERARIDFNEFPELSQEEVQAIVDETNAIIKENYPISYRTVTRAEAENESGLIKTFVNLLPAHVTEVRLVSIGSIDEQACGGTHVKATGEIGMMKITDIKSKGKNNRRFEVVATR